MQPQLTPQQAIEVITQATAQLSATREVHSTIVQAIEVLMNLTNQSEVETKSN